MKFKEFLESVDYLKDFQEEAMKMWVTKYKRVYKDENIISTKDAIYIDYVTSKVQILKFGKSDLTISGFEGESAIKYQQDELKFIKEIQKAARENDVRPLKNLKAMNDNILLRDFEKYSKYDEFFTSVHNLIMKYKRDGYRILKCLGLNQISVKTLKDGDTIYLFDVDRITLGAAVKLPIERVKVSSIVFRDEDEVVINNINLL